MGMSKETLEKNIKKMLSVIKPEGVIMVDFTLSEIDKNEYYVGFDYIVPNDSEYLGKHLTGTQIRDEWNNQLLKTIEGYFSTNLILNSSSTMSEKFYKQQKEREKLWQKN
jgi:hypothetical protein